MSKKDKLIDRLLKKPIDFTFDEMESLLSYFGYKLKRGGTGSGHREIEKGWFVMSNLLSYKNYNGTVEYSKEDGCLFGKVIGIKSLLSYEGDSVKELEQGFRNVIDEYLEDCKERNVEPEQSYKGTFNVRISPELHRNIAVYAIEHGKSLNAAVEEAIGNMVG